MTFHFHRDSIYTGTARFDGSARALTEDEVFKSAPSIFATTAHESRSARFAPIPTIEVLRGLQKEGFSPVGVKQSTSRIPGKENFTKHLIRLRRLDDAAKYKVGDTVFEMLLKNANDGTCRYSLMAGLFRIACKNSLVALVDTLDDVKIGHSGALENVQHKVIEGTYRVLDNAEAALAAPQDWSQLQLAGPEQLAFAEAAHVLRFEEGTAPVEPVKLLQRNRREDVPNDLWTVFNRVQENTIKGGLHGQRIDDNGRVRRVTTRPINGIDQDVKLNRAMFTLAAKMAEIKTAA